jgi:hypothetical protein
VVGAAHKFRDLSKQLGITVENRERYVERFTDLARIPAVVSSSASSRAWARSVISTSAWA